jgi:excisionase family DNA binding protein
MAIGLEAETSWAACIISLSMTEAKQRLKAKSDRQHLRGSGVVDRLQSAQGPGDRSTSIAHVNPRYSAKADLTRSSASVSRIRLAQRATGLLAANFGGHNKPNMDGDIRDFIVAEVRRQIATLARDTWGTPAEAAEWARVSKSHLLRLCRGGLGPQHSGDGKLMRFRRSAVDRWLDNKRKGFD